MFKKKYLSCMPSVPININLIFFLCPYHSAIKRAGIRDVSDFTMGSGSKTWQMNQRINKGLPCLCPTKDICPSVPSHANASFLFITSMRMIAMFIL